MVKSNNNAICHFFSLPKLTSKPVKWQELLAEFDFKFKHKKGTNNQATDALNHKEQYGALCMLAPMHSSKIDVSMQNIIREFIQKDPSAQAVVALAKASKTIQF